MKAPVKSTIVRNLILTWMCVLAATPGWGRVLLRWTQTAIPPAAKIGLKDVVISWDAPELIKTAHDQGYMVYAEVPLGKAADLAHSAKSNLAGIVVDPQDTRAAQLDDELRRLKTDNPGFSVLFLDHRAKQPQMKGQLVIKRDGVLQVTSPTAQPWIDSNLALVRIDKAFRPSETPMYEFKWELSDSVQQEHGPDPADYALAVAEVGAFHGDLLLDLDPTLQAGLLKNDPKAWAVLEQISRYSSFSAGEEKNLREPEANVGVITDSYQKAYESTNLLARHNIPFAVLNAADLKPHSLEAFEVIVVFANPDPAIAAAIVDFASKGGVAVVVGAHGSFPWQSGQTLPAGEHSLGYAAGQGRVIELPGPIIDPETFAQDIRRLIDKQKIEISLWNALTVVAVPYSSASGEKTVELVNYSQEPIPVQVQIKGAFSSVRYESPEQPCCQSLAPMQRGAYTEFVIPSLRIAGRVHLSNR
jgi:hypothetical protein